MKRFVKAELNSPLIKGGATWRKQRRSVKPGSPQRTKDLKPGACGICLLRTFVRATTLSTGCLSALK